MTIIKKDVNKLGEFWIKKLFSGTLDDDGEEHALAALSFPAYTWPGYLWLKWSVMSIAEMMPWTTSEFIMKGRHVNVPEGLTFADNMTDLMEQYAPIDEAAADGSTTTTADAVDVTGWSTHLLEGSKAYTFLDREYKFGLPDNAYPCAASRIRYTAFGKYAGHCGTSQMVNVAEPHMIFIGGLTEMPGPQTTNQSYSVYGDHTDFGDLYTSLVDLYKGDASGDQSSDMIDAALLAYQGQGFSIDDASETASPDDIPDDADLYTRLEVTCRLDVYEPDTRSRVLAP